MCSPGPTVGGHHHELIPGREHAQRGEIRQLGHAVTKLLECGHAPKPRQIGSARRAAPAVRAPRARLNVMAKIWRLDTETKGTGAHVVPLETVPERTAADEELATITLERPPRRIEQPPPLGP